MATQAAHYMYYNVHAVASAWYAIPSNKFILVGSESLAVDFMKGAYNRTALEMQLLFSRAPFTSWIP